MQRSLVAFLSAAFAAFPAAHAQELPPPRVESIAVAGGAIECVVQLPAGHDPLHYLPVAMLLTGAANADAVRQSMASYGQELARRGWAVVAPVLPADARAAGPLFAWLRRTCRIEQGGLHAAATGDVTRPLAFVRRHRHEFQTVTTFGAVTGTGFGPGERLPGRRIGNTPAGDGSGLAGHLVALHAARTLPGAAGEVAAALDDFHDAAANGDEQRYFAILRDDAVFLGTDGTERWTGKEFRAFAMPYFQRDSAWTYVAIQRHVDVGAGGAVAWFDEVLDNAAYGECRGSGVLEKRDGGWVVRQYNLTVAVPNELAQGIAARIRAFQDHAAPVAVTTVLVVRHGEKVDASSDAELSDAGRARGEALAKALRDVPFTAVYATQFRRTAGTVAPLCAAKGLTPRVVPAADTRALVARLTKEHLGEHVLVCGHSNTVPDILTALGAMPKVTLGDDEYDRLFVVTLGVDGARLLSLRF